MKWFRKLVDDTIDLLICLPVFIFIILCVYVVLKILTILIK